MHEHIHSKKILSTKEAMAGSCSPAKFKLEILYPFLTERVINHWNTWWREEMDSPSLIFKLRRGVILEDVFKSNTKLLSSVQR